MYIMMYVHTLGVLSAAIKWAFVDIFLVNEIKIKQKIRNGTNDANETVEISAENKPYYVVTVVMNCENEFSVFLPFAHRYAASCVEFRHIHRNTWSEHLHFHINSLVFYFELEKIYTFDFFIGWKLNIHIDSDSVARCSIILFGITHSLAQRVCQRITWTSSQL